MRALILVTTAALIGCRDERGTTYACHCTYLTDFDDAASVDTSVCAPTAARAGEIARGCAQGRAPAPIQACVCANPAAACDRPGCE